MTRLRTGLSNAILSTLFAIDKRRIDRAVKTARVALMFSFVPRHLGIDHISPDSIITNHTTSMSKTLFANGEDVCIFADGKNNDASIFESLLRADSSRLRV